jgi:Nucleotidyltransferase domain
MIKMKAFHKKALTEAVHWIEAHFKPIGIIASGSIIRGNPNKDSDFDIYVIHEQPFRQRIQKYFNQVPCEIFVNTFAHTQSSFLNEQNDNRPVTAHMIATGKVIKGQDNDIVKQAIKEANVFKNKTKATTEFDRIIYKYFITNLLEDANDTILEDPITSAYILNRALDKLIDYWFVINQIPLTRIKERMSTIKNKDVAFYNKIKLIYNANDMVQKLNHTNTLVASIIKTTGFFEWTSERLFDFE